MLSLNQKMSLFKENAQQHVSIFFFTIHLVVLWQLTALGRQRSARLSNGLTDLRHNNVLLEDLLAWLNNAEMTLADVDRQTIPQDMAIIQQLIKEHQVKGRISLYLIKVMYFCGGCTVRSLGIGCFSMCLLKDTVWSFLFSLEGFRCQSPQSSKYKKKSNLEQDIYFYILLLLLYNCIMCHASEKV